MKSPRFPGALFTTAYRGHFESILNGKFNGKRFEQSWITVKSLAIQLANCVSPFNFFNYQQLVVNRK